MNLLETQGLQVEIGQRRVLGGAGLHLVLRPGDRLAILGRNGAGKTTLLHTLAGLIPPRSGAIRLAGRSYAELGPRPAARLRGLLPQHQGDAFPATVMESVLIGRHPHLSRWAWEGPADLDLARRALADVGLAELERREIHTLSGGERQRVALATLLAQAPRVYFLDEPLSHLDLNHQIAMLERFTRRAVEEAAALVLVLHDLNLAAHYCNLALLLHGEGRFELGAAAEMLRAERLGALFGHPLRELDGGWLAPVVPGRSSGAI